MTSEEKRRRRILPAIAVVNGKVYNSDDIMPPLAGEDCYARPGQWCDGFTGRGCIHCGCVVSSTRVLRGVIQNLKVEGKIVV